MTSGWIPSSFQRGMIFSAAPVSKCTFVTPFNFAHIKLFPEIDGNRLKCLLWHLLPCAHEGKDDLDQPERYEDVDLEEPPRLEVLAFLDSRAVAIDTALYFIPLGSIHWLLGIAMGCANMAGSWVGARTAIHLGERFIRRVLVIVMTLMLLRLSAQILGWV